MRRADLVQPHEAAPRRKAVLGEAEAVRLIDGVAATMRELSAALEEETGHLAAGRIRDSLACESRKAKLAGDYVLGLEAIKANAVALARFAPGQVVELKRVHEAFRAVIERNQAVLATARAVTDGLVKSLAEELARASRPQTYGAAPSGPVRARPLTFSARL